MKQNPIDEKLSQCTSEVSEYCYYTENDTNKYKWSNSYINYYLNNVYIKTLSSELSSKIKEDAICDDFINVGCTDNEGCGGYTEEEITKNNYTCNNYSKSKIRIISYNEYVKLYDSVKNKSILKGNYWIINNGIDGYLIPCYNVKNMAEKICDLIENFNLRKSFSSHAKDNLDKFGKNKIINQWVSLIEDL